LKTKQRLQRFTLLISQYHPVTVINYCLKSSDLSYAHYNDKFIQTIN
jgi:uncharacterized ubiquitin-like protein YukD